MMSNSSGNKQAEYSYTAWGQLRNPTSWQTYNAGSEPSLLFGRGYTGHEHLHAFGLKNMNAHLYDASTGRFLSPAPYVQAPDFTQNFNRYSYALNNPLKFTDPDGEFWHLIIGAAIGGVFNWAANGAEFTWDGLGYFGIGAVAGAVGAGVGAGISSAMAGGSFGAGFAGSSTAMTTSSSFVSGAAIGGGAGFSGGYTTGFGNALVGGENLGNAFGTGLKAGLIGGVSGGLIGGVLGGLDARLDNRTFLKGDFTYDSNGAKIPTRNDLVGQVQRHYNERNINDKLVARGNSEGQYGWYDIESIEITKIRSQTNILTTSREVYFDIDAYVKDALGNIVDILLDTVFQGLGPWPVQPGLNLTFEQVYPLYTFTGIYPFKNK